MERRAGSRGASSSAYGGATYDSHLESENDALIGQFQGKVETLKQLSIQINGHIKEDNNILSDLDNSFDSTSGLLGGTMKRLGNLAQSSGGNVMCYLAVFVMVVFLLLWRLTKS